MVQVAKCPDCGEGPFPSKSAMKKHLREKHPTPAMKRANGNGRRAKRKPGVMPCNPRYCWNCGVPQPREVAL